MGKYLKLCLYVFGTYILYPQKIIHQFLSSDFLNWRKSTGNLRQLSLSDNSQPTNSSHYFRLLDTHSRSIKLFPNTHTHTPNNQPTQVHISFLCIHFPQFFNATPISKVTIIFSTHLNYLHLTPLLSPLLFILPLLTIIFYVLSPTQPAD